MLIGGGLKQIEVVRFCENQNKDFKERTVNNFDRCREVTENEALCVDFSMFSKVQLHISLFLNYGDADNMIQPLPAVLHKLK